MTTLTDSSMVDLVAVGMQSHIKEMIKARLGAILAVEVEKINEALDTIALDAAKSITGQIESFKSVGENAYVLNVWFNSKKIL